MWSDVRYNTLFCALLPLLVIILRGWLVCTVWGTDNFCVPCTTGGAAVVVFGNFSHQKIVLGLDFGKNVSLLINFSLQISLIRAEFVFPLNSFKFWSSGRNSVGFGFTAVTSWLVDADWQLWVALQSTQQLMYNDLGCFSCHLEVAIIQKSYLFVHFLNSIKLDFYQKTRTVADDIDCYDC